MNSKGLLAIIGLLFFSWPGLSQAQMADLQNFKLSNLHLGDQEFTLGIGIRFGMEFHVYDFDLNDQIETTPAHPADSPTGFTTTNLQHNPDGLATRWVLGPMLTLQMGKIIFSGGVDLRYEDFKKGYRKGLYDTKLADYGGESYAFTQIEPQSFTFSPFLGLGYNFVEPLAIYGEFGLPSSSFKIRTGHDRWGRWQTVREDKWQGLGQRYSLGLIVYPQNNLSIDCQVFHERYQVEFFKENASIADWGVTMRLIFQYELTK